MVLLKIIFGSGNRHGKDKKKYIINDTISSKISFMDYMKWTIVMLLIAFEEFEVVHIFLLLFFFSLSFSVGKRSTLAKTLGGGGGCSLTAPFFPLVSTGLNEIKWKHETVLVFTKIFNNLCIIIHFALCIFILRWSN